MRGSSRTTNLSLTITKSFESTPSVEANALLSTWSSSVGATRRDLKQFFRVKEPHFSDLTPSRGPASAADTTTAHAS
jgi:hypothetical protein